ncbi:non-oxidative hydroxyarylic acid decarboxylases subunit C [Streptomyces huiliensis]|uniref:non-oxidative hydroxyarylic acid decarboxylases subunit C n=1 Tax=Streptomyces huiliensis TaxID=2876027 RepID=UPI001CBAC5C5|nr:non-oxidative hydroxyarylic acid decarboxylases subunit C [Streptomyces huiliensis]MBZ4317851.1 UbiD family decarboxylase [Streptomyces huiliensis]
MPYDDLRAFLDALDEQGQLVHITEPVDPEADLAVAANAAARMGPDAPALCFERVTGYPTGRVAVNVHGSWANHALALELPPTTPVRRQVEEFSRRWESFPVPPEYREAPPFLAHTLHGDDVDLYSVLPLFRLNAHDGGFYVDKAAVITRDPADPGHFGKQNVGIYRLQCKGRRRFGIQPGSIHDIARHLRSAEERGEDLPVAVALGNDPVISLVAATPMAYDESEYELAGALRGAPAPIARAPLTDLDVPWGCEVLMEGVIKSRVREIEGPFGEFTGHYSGGRRMPVIRIDRISYRTDPLFEHLYLGLPWTEIDHLMGPATCVPLLQQLRAEFPEVVAVNAMYTHGLVAIVSTRSRVGGFARAVGLRVATTPHGLGYCKVVIVVDETVDPFDLPQVMWALSTKFNPADDLIQLPVMPILPLDPSSDPAGISGKVVLDATTPTAPDRRGRHTAPVQDLPGTGVWLEKLRGMTDRARR